MACELLARRPGLSPRTSITQIFPIVALRIALAIVSARAGRGGTGDLGVCNCMPSLRRSFLCCQLFQPPCLFCLPCLLSFFEQLLRHSRVSVLCHNPSCRASGQTMKNR